MIQIISTEGGDTPPPQVCAKKGELRWTDQERSGENTNRTLYKVRRKGKEGQMKFARFEGGS